uniref:Uncharacterized protein n=1 Tax=Anopheles culicifacies TaxID=139723 RepID=A0A182M0P6_9DIPT
MHIHYDRFAAIEIFRKHTQIDTIFQIFCPLFLRQQLHALVHRRAKLWFRHIQNTVPRFHWNRGLKTALTHRRFGVTFNAVKMVNTSTSANVPSSFTTPVSMGMFFLPPPAFMTSYGELGKIPEGPPIVMRPPYTSTGRLSDGRHLFGISPERCDILLNPLERQQHIHNGRITGNGVRFGGQKPKRSQPILWYNEHDILLEQILGWMLSGTTTIESTAMNIHGNRSLGASVLRIHAQTDAIFQIGRQLIFGKFFKISIAGSSTTSYRYILHTFPGLYGNRGLKTVLSYRWLSVPYVQVLLDRCSSPCTLRVRTLQLTKPGNLHNGGNITAEGSQHGYTTK